MVGSSNFACWMGSVWERVGTRIIHHLTMHISCNNSMQKTSQGQKTTVFYSITVIVFPCLVMGVGEDDRY